MSRFHSESSQSLIINTYSRTWALNQLLRVSLHCNGYLRSGSEFIPSQFTPNTTTTISTKTTKLQEFCSFLSAEVVTRFCFCSHKTEVLPPRRTFALRALKYGTGGVWEGALVSGRWRRRSLLRQSGAASCTWLRSQWQGGGRSSGRSWKSDEMTWLVEKQVRPECTGTQGQRQHSNHHRRSIKSPQ